MFDMAAREPVCLELDALRQQRGDCVITLGVFDGVHRGHAELIGHAVRLGISRDTATLTTLDRRAELARGLGVDEVVVLPFTHQFARLSPGTFVEDVLVGSLRARAIAVGRNFTFGHLGSGDVATLHRLAREHSVSVDAIGLVQNPVSTCSSTYIRDCLRDGDVRAAAHALARPHRIDGRVDPVAGERIEFVVDGSTAIPGPGGYAARLRGTELVDVTISPDRHLIVATTRQRSGGAYLEFLDRAGP
jgi:riboflavin kinase/FMN adenylyltransferase